MVPSKPAGKHVYLGEAVIALLPPKGRDARQSEDGFDAWAQHLQGQLNHSSTKVFLWRVKV